MAAANIVEKLMSKSLHSSAFYSKQISNKPRATECAPVVTNIPAKMPQVAIAKSFRRKDRDILLANYEKSFFPDQALPGVPKGKGKQSNDYPTPSALYRSCVMKP